LIKATYRGCPLAVRDMVVCSEAHREQLLHSCVLHASLEFRTLLCPVGVCTHKQHCYTAFEWDMYRSFDELHTLAHPYISLP
jgi:hypothetical protein